MNKDVLTALPFVMFFGFFGAIIRYGLTLVSSMNLDQVFIIFVINILGSVGLGFVYNIPFKRQAIKSGVMVGFFGALTTLSTLFSQSEQLFELSIYWPIVLLLGTTTIAYLGNLLAHQVMSKGIQS